LKVLTVLIEVPDDRAAEAFREMIEECAHQVIAADEATLTVHLRDEADHR
jgi:hypothetical protein